MNPLRVYAKHRIAKTSIGVIIEDLTQAQLASVQSGGDEAADRANDLIASKTWKAEIPKGTPIEDWLATPIPADWEPREQFFRDRAMLLENLSVAQARDLTMGITALSISADAPSFRNGRGEDPGAESGLDGSEVREAAVGDPRKAG